MQAMNQRHQKIYIIIGLVAVVVVLFVYFTMLLYEIRVILPFTIDEYYIGHIYSANKYSKQNIQLQNTDRFPSIVRLSLRRSQEGYNFISPKDCDNGGFSVWKKILKKKH